MINTVRIKRKILKLLYVFPIEKNKIFFSSYEGKQYTCNPKYIFEAMCENKCFDQYKFVWELNDKTLSKNIQAKYLKRISGCVKHNSPYYFYSMLTSKYVITNSGVTGAIPVRKDQVNINTWHGGGAYKKVGFANEDTVDDRESLKLSSDQTDFYLSSSEIFTEVMRDSILLDRKKFLAVGMPRNDMFFNDKIIKKINSKIRKKYSISSNDFLVLFAPTYRGKVGQDDFEGITFDVKSLEKAILNRFDKKMSLMVRMHYFNKKQYKNDDVISVSDYPDMQELLAAADMLITDYSSSMWDFALTKKMCLLYVDDLREYEGNRGLYTPISTWPGIVCGSTEEMINAIETFDEKKYSDKIEKYLNASGSYDKGIATKCVLDLIKRN